MKKIKLYLGADHGGYNVKEFVKSYLVKQGYTVEDMGTYSKDSVDYPDFAKKVALAVKKDKNSLGILACGTGIGISIAANKFPGIRAALCNDVRCARLSRNHNDANILALAGRPYNGKKVTAIVKAWLSAGFDGGRHLRRINKIKAIENKSKV
jgi:ribose 5-phosphate isomerase B